VEPLGSGTWTTTYSARPEGCSEDIPPDYAVKVLLPRYEQKTEAIQLLRRESMVGRQVAHPYVISILAARVDRGPYYLVMPRLDGLSLRSVLRHVDRLPCGRALWFARKVAEGLGALHQHGWLHGDVKPDNIVVSSHGHVTLVDLGLARPLNEMSRVSRRALMGTLKYAAPESFVNSRTEDQRSDFYSLGVTLYELLTGQLPFQGNDPRQLVNAHLRQSPPNPRRLVPQLPRSINRLLQPMLAKEPMRRPQSAEELVAHLVRLEIETFGLSIGG
jgi:serine/threonine-protein kinase